MMQADAVAAVLPIDQWLSSEARFHTLFPTDIQLLAHKHWTPLNVARKAAGFLAAEKNARILDIGSGIGKFCLTAAHCMPNAFYTGVEQRLQLVDHAIAARDKMELKNIEFIHGNFTQLDFKKYDHFYFFNSFYENFAFTSKIDNNIDYSTELYHYYARYLKQQLEQKPAGTRLATFHSLEDEIPEDYLVVGAEMENVLKFWVKV
jgi:SAM-dependent methyltransferase